MDILASIVLSSPNTLKIFYNSNTLLVFIFLVMSQVLHLYLNLFVCFNEHKTLQFFCLSLTNNSEYVNFILLHFFANQHVQQPSIEKKMLKKYI